MALWGESRIDVEAENGQHAGGCWEPHMGIR